MRELAEGLGLPHGDVRRLWWAGRLHDLGKVSVDAAALRKTGLLNTHDWEAMRRAPRLSARLLQRFRFAAQQAKAVEYHRERLDGSGYYGAHGNDIPLAAHFLILADAFDAMTSERPFRPALSDEDALAEIERNAGTQFHPALAKAFAAVKRGLSPDDVLTEDELSAIRDSSERSPVRPGVAELGHSPELIVAAGVTLGLVGLGIGLSGARGCGRRHRSPRRASLADDPRASPSAGRRDRRCRLRRRPPTGVRPSHQMRSRPRGRSSTRSWSHGEENGTDGSIELERGESTIPEAGAHELAPA